MTQYIHGFAIGIIFILSLEIIIILCYLFKINCIDPYFFLRKKEEKILLLNPNLNIEIKS